ncbi:putative lipid II flippase FtsW [Amycolatopsis panacis]|uniref:Probable peptidoglycan glycosyltransferase FtsW n=1 Tax=Amycolatopsis panacis TaxID=2340917 RepID=A0A419I7J7_9PSEU|nr:putative lipid II flippase FtsW [Amycolatopsis panacis]RJQ87849.1 putative lipid II flippase FtsW [Amycolatopsis panacis]
MDFRAGGSAIRDFFAHPLASFRIIVVVGLALTVLGAVMALSATAAAANPASGVGVYQGFARHLLYVAIGLAAFVAGLRIPLAKLRRAAVPALGVAIVGLVLVLTPLGSDHGGAQRWLAAGPITVQPVEIAKVALVLWGAHLLVAKRHLVQQWRHLLVPLVPVTLVLCALVLAQPNLSGTVTLALIALGLLWFADAPRRLFLALVAGGGAGILVLALFANYRLARVLSFLSSDADVSGSGYQAQQAQYALADGGWFGVGLGQGAAKWSYLPDVQNDFVFALIGEELGFAGCVLVLVLFGLLAVAGLRTAADAADPWVRLVAATTTLLLVAQALINIGYVTGILPVTGVTLPLVSSGGTSLVITMLQFGVLAQAARQEARTSPVGTVRA